MMVFIDQSWAVSINQELFFDNHVARKISGPLPKLCVLKYIIQIIGTLGDGPNTKE